MKKWHIEYWDDLAYQDCIESWLDSLNEEQLKSVAKELKMLQLCGNNLKLPHSRALKDGLFEVRERRYNYRIYYSFLEDNTIILLAAGDKSTQEHDIEIARSRLNDLNNQVG